MTELQPWVFSMELRPGPTIDQCWLKLEGGTSNDPNEVKRIIWIPAAAILQIEQGFTRARHMIAGHLKGVQEILDQAKIELAAIPETEEPNK